MPTLLPKKYHPAPVAVDDDHYTAMAADPSIPEIPQGSSWGANYMQQAAPVQQNYSGDPALTAAAESNAASGADVLVANNNQDWINKKWRPAMGWMYMVVCVTDFILFPVLWAVVQFWEVNPANDAFRQWQPLTLQGAGLFHIAMGAVLGIAAYGRTKEKVEGRA